MSEFSRCYDLRMIPDAAVRIAADAAECAALARRFGLVAVNHLTADIALTTEGATVLADGRFEASVVQSCAVSGEDLPVTIAEPIHLRFVPEAAVTDLADEIEISASDCDEIAMQNGQFDLGEAVAQSLALAIDPFATGPGAEEVRRKAGLLDEGEGGAFAALKGLKLPKG